MSEIHLGASAQFYSDDRAEHHLSKRLRLIRNEQRIPLLCVDMDDTFLPFGKVITEHERDAVKAYLQTGGHIAFNTLAPKEWFYLRVIEPVALAFHEDHCTHLLSRLHWIVSGGGEVFVYEHTKCSYRRVHGSSARSKAEGLLSLLTHLGPEVRVLAFYGDRFDDPQNDGNAIGAGHIPLVVNVGTDQIVSSTPKQIFINARNKGPTATLNDLRLITAQLQKGIYRVLSEPPQAVDESKRDKRSWRFDFANAGPGMPDTPISVKAHGPGFLWSWNDRGLCYLTPLIPNSRLDHLAGKACTERHCLKEAQTLRSSGREGRTCSAGNHRATGSNETFASGIVSGPMEAISESEALVERSEERWWCAELHRIRGVFLAAIGAEVTQIEASFCAAINTATGQKSVSPDQILAEEPMVCVHEMASASSFGFLTNQNRNTARRGQNGRWR